MAENFLELENVTVGLSGAILLNDISFAVRRNEQWAIIGPSGSGKTLLVNILAGKYFHRGKIKYHFPVKKNNKSTIIIVEQQHRFKNLFNTNDLYYQQRFNSYDSEQTITVEQEIRSHAGEENFIDSEWLGELHVRSLLSEPLIQLSNGENKRVQIVIALLESPELLILDNPFIGLDAEGRKTLHHIIQNISQKGIQILLISSYLEIPECITHIACLESGALIFADVKEKFQPKNSIKGKNELDEELLKRLQPPAGMHFSIAVKMVNVNIKYGDKQILQDINWEVKKGEHWNLSGPNGAGKSTLLSLVTADNPQAYANEIYLFDRRRGTGESIWDIKQKIGFVSPELHLYFDFSATCFEVIGSGLFDTIGLFRELNNQQEENVLLWLKLFGLENIRSKRLSQISISQQRITLLARALIKTPPLLILDEPCQGLDDEQAANFKNLINQICEAFDTTLVYVSHYKNQIPECVHHFLQIENGKCVCVRNQ
jgi:molybdate transport system ATP-binding protein